MTVLRGWAVAWLSPGHWTFSWDNACFTSFSHFSGPVSASTVTPFTLSSALSFLFHFCPPRAFLQYHATWDFHELEGHSSAGHWRLSPGLMWWTPSGLFNFVPQCPAWEPRVGYGPHSGFMQDLWAGLSQGTNTQNTQSIQSCKEIVTQQLWWNWIITSWWRNTKHNFTIFTMIQLILPHHSHSECTAACVKQDFYP